MILKTFLISNFFAIVFSLSVFSAFAAGAGECSGRNDCNDCPSKSASDCYCFCRSSGHDPNCSDGLFNGHPNGVRCVGDLSCPNLSRCVMEDCACSPGGGGGGGNQPPPTQNPNASPPPSSIPIDFKMMVLGRIFIDNNRNGVYDSGDVFIQSFDNMCGTYENIRATIKVKNKNTGEEVDGFIDKCNPEPYYNFFNLRAGDYSVEVYVPGEWDYTTPRSVSLSLSDKYDNHVWFGVSEKLNYNCQSFDVSSQVCLSQKGNASAVFTGTTDLTNVSYKYESACVKFPNDAHVYVTNSSNVEYTPTGLGSCEISVAASVDGVNYLSCPKKNSILLDCNVGCGSIVANPSIIKVGQSSNISVSPHGLAPFYFNWSSPFSSCRLVPSGSQAVLYADDVPRVNNVESSCQVTVNVKDKSFGTGIDCSVGVGVVRNASPISGTPSWFKTIDGDVRSNSWVSVNIPVGSYFSSFVVSSIKPSIFDLVSARTGEERASEKGWLVTEYGGEPDYSIVNFDSLIAGYPPFDSAEQNELKSVDFASSFDKLVTPSLGVQAVSINEPINVPDDKVIRYYINGDLEINSNLNVSAGSAVLFVVKGDMYIKDSVTDISGAYFVDGTVNLTNNLRSSVPLRFNGILGVSANGKLFGLYRDLGGQNDLPSEIFIFEPKYLVKLLPLFNKTKRVWVEVAP